MNILEFNILFIIIYAMLFIAFRNNKALKIIFISLTTIQLILLNGLRDITIGFDTIRYYRMFQQNKSIVYDISINSEIGYDIIQYIFKIFCDNYSIYLLTIAIIIYTILAVIIYKHSKGCFWSYLLFITLGFFDFSFTGIKQTIAIIIILSSYKDIIDRKKYKFIVKVMLAFIFHKSAIVFIPAYFISNIKWKRIHIFILPSIYIIIYMFRDGIGKILTILYYGSGSEMLDRYVNTGSIGGLSILILIILILGFVAYNPRIYPDRDNVMLTNIMIVSLILQTLSSFSYLFTRINMFYLVFIILYIPNILYGVNKRLKYKDTSIKGIKIMLELVCVILFIYYYVINVGLNNNGIIPYQLFN